MMPSPKFVASYRYVKKQLAKCPDSEPEQAGIRVVIGIFVLLYFYSVGAFTNDSGTLAPSSNLAAMIIFLAASVSVLFAIVKAPQRSVTRRLLGLMVDVSFTTYAMCRADAISAPLYIVYLWVAFGNGFRFGPKYLFAASALSMLGFTVVITTNQYWNNELTLSLGLLAGLLILPLYVAALPIGD